MIVRKRLGLRSPAFVHMVPLAFCCLPSCGSGRCLTVASRHTTASFRVRARSRADQLRDGQALEQLLERLGRLHPHRDVRGSPPRATVCARPARDQRTSPSAALKTLATVMLSGGRASKNPPFRPRLLFTETGDSQLPHQLLHVLGRCPFGCRDLGLR